MKCYKRDNLDKVEPYFEEYRKKVLTKAARIKGPFQTLTREGTLECQDGYLAVDSEGWPYPIAKSEFEAIYEKVED
jgi:hypothetical protein